MIFKRSLWLVIHRWAGLIMSLLLIVVALTGSLLAFHPELERLINPQFYSDQHDRDTLDIGMLAARVEQIVPDAQINSIFLEGNQGLTFAMVRMPATSNGYTDFDQLILNPHTGEELGRRKFGAISQGMTNFMPFIYKLHYTLLLDKIGVWILGICAALWTIDCFVGFYLTLPARNKVKREINHNYLGNSSKSWWQRWQPAWKIRLGASFNKLNFDLHRANGLWLWIILLMFAWSSVYMNMWDSVYTWATRVVLEYRAPWTEIAKLPAPLQKTELSWHEASIVGQRLMAEHAQAHQISVEKVVGMKLDRERGIYNYTVRSSRDIQDRRGVTRVYFDANTGELRLATLPTGQWNGNTVTSWLYALHMGNVFGLTWRIFVCVMGFVITLLSVTGIVIWMKKRQARQISHLIVTSNRSSN